jgi:peptidoglycan/xylan/chitin deacetylase (PgdA/CDA1 family)
VEHYLYDYWPIIQRPKLEWPKGARLAFWIGLNVEHFELGKPSTSITPVTAGFVPDPLNHGWRDYGARVGIWRTMEALDAYGIRASVPLNSDVCNLYPQIIEEGRKRNWVWLVHGKNHSTKETGMPVEEERSYLNEVVSTIRMVTGEQPRGWLGPSLTETFNTPDLLAEAGITYICDWCNDDQPYPMKVKTGQMISIPYAIELNDLSLVLGRGYSGPELGQALMDQFDVLYEEGTKTGRVMAVALHPFIAGQPFRHRYLDRALQYIAGHDGVWMATSDEIADWYYRHYYDQAVAHGR